MTVIGSKVTLNATAESVYNFLADLNNHKQLMPENVINWSSTKDEARFNIQNMAKLALKISSRQPSSEIIIDAIDAPPFPMQIKWEIKEGDKQIQVSFTLAAELNMMLKMLASNPLQKLADHETQRLHELFA